MKTFIYFTLICLLWVGSGCATGSTIRTARGSKATNDKGEIVVTEKPAPGVYVLLPFAFAFDVATSPFQACAALAFSRMAKGFP
jgi:hypothetical protein